MNKCVLFSSYQSQNPYLRIQQYLTLSNVLLVLHVEYRLLSEESQERCNHNSDFIETFKYQNLLVLNKCKFVSSSPQVGTDSPLISRPMVTVEYPGKKNSTYQTNIKVTGTTGLHTVCTHIVDSG